MTSNHQPKANLRLPAGPLNEAPLDLAAAAAFACAVFVSVYWLFRWCQPWIIAAHTPLSPADFTAWVRWAVAEQDGRELPVASVGILFCIGICFEITRRGMGRRWLSYGLARWACHGAAAAVAWSIRSSEFSSDARSSGLLVAVAALILGTAWLAPRACSWRWLRASAAALFATTVVVVVLFTTGNPSISDFGYMIGPALEWMQGEALGSFYMQYSLLGTLITAALMRLGLRIHGMELALAGLAIGWFALYWWLARELIRDRVLRALFLVCLFAFRVLWMSSHLVAMPQTSPFRMELWVPLVLVARKRGLSSPWTAGCCAALYALDALFGLLYLVVYLASVAFELEDARRRGEMRASTVLGILIPIALAGIVNFAVFGSLVARSATYYLDVKLGFLPISPVSMFWAVLLILLLAVVVFARAGSERRFGMFLVLIATAQMIYFLGRSHDHNLINIGGAWLLVAFVALDAALLQSMHFARTAASLLMLGILGLGSQRIVSSIEQGFEKLVHGPWFEENDLDRLLDSTRADWPTNTPTVIVVSDKDAYMNYRLGLRQHGYYSPIFAHLVLEETATWLHGEMMRGQRVIIPGADRADWRGWQEVLSELNNTRFMTEHSSSFAFGSVFTLYHELALLR